jgi:hypothetical protein
MKYKELIEANGLTLHGDIEHFAELVAAHEREAIMKSIEELRPVENNPLLQNKPAAFWVENFRQIVYARGTT